MHSNVSVVLVLDLSKPEELWNTLEVFIKQVNELLALYLVGRHLYIALEFLVSPAKSTVGIN